MEIDKQAKKHKRIIPCLLQIYIASEETKFGLSDKELYEILDNPNFKDLKNIRIDGLMGMASNSKDLELVRKEFKHLKKKVQPWCELAVYFFEKNIKLIYS